MNRRAGKSRSVWTHCIPVGIIAGALAVGASSAQESEEAAQAVGVVYHDRNRNGVRDEAEKGIPGVRVSNQLEIVKTDARGRWRLPADDDTTFFVIKPRGWMTPVDPETMLPRFYYTHKPKGSPPVKHGGVKPTGPLPESIDFPLHVQQEPASFRSIFFGDTQSRNDEEIRYMARDVIGELVGFDGAFGVTLGDIVFDNLSIFDHHNRTVALIGLPWYNVIGNHDINYDVPDDRHSDETFERIFGPNYYAFEYGPTHFIVLDNIQWFGETEKKKGHYAGNLGQDQLTFIKNDLADVPKEKLIVLTMHIPITDTGDREQLFRLIENRPYTLSIAAHRHHQSHRFLTEKEGWRGAKPHHHVVHVTVCGSWWAGAPDELGIPHATMPDGAPNGYSIITFDGHEASIEFKAARRPADYQMNIYAPDRITVKEAAETEVLANVFAGSERSKVRMRLGKSGAWRPMKKVYREDPAFVRMKTAEESEKPPRGRKLPKVMKSPHIWQGTLPAHPPVGVQLIYVRTTDMYGKTYTASRKIRIVGD